MVKREELRLDLTANDKASAPIGDVADKVEKLDGVSAAVELTADDNASDDIDRVDGALNDIDGRTADATLEATDNASDDVDKVDSGLTDLDGRTADATLEATDNASGDIATADGKLDAFDIRTADATLEANDLATSDIKGVDDKLDAFDIRTADATLDANDLATSDIKGVDDKLDKLDKRMVDPTIDATMGAGLQGALEALDGMPGKIGSLSGIARGVMSPAGAVAGLIGGLAAAAVSTSNAALNVQTMANFTGEDFAYVDKFTRVFEGLGGLDANDLIEMVSEVANTIAADPALAALLGVDPGFVANHPLQGLVEIVDGINEAQLSTADRMNLIMKVFGEEGGKQISKILGMGVDLSELIEGMPSVLTEEDAANAVKLKLQMAEVVAQAQQLAAQIGGPVLAASGKVMESFETWRDLFDGLSDEGAINLPDFPDSWRDFVDGMESMDLQSLMVQFSELGGNLQRVEDGHMRLADAQAAVELGLPTEGFELTAEAAAYLAETEAEATEATDETADAALEAAEALEEHKEALEEDIGVLEEHIDLLTDQADGFRDAADAADDAEEADRELVEATMDYNDAIFEFGAGSDEAAEALRGVRDAAIKVADAQVTLAQSQAQARGETLSAVQALNIMNGSLLAQAMTLNGPARQAILQRIADVNAIPSDVMTQISAAIARGDLAEAQRLLDSASAPRDALMQAEADQAALRDAERQLAWLSRDRPIYLRPRVTRGVGGGGGGGIPLRATGDSYTNRGLTLVGEQGPELVDMPAGAGITNAGQTAEWMRNAGGGGTHNYYTTINNPAGVRARDTEQASRRYRRLQAS